MSCNECYRVLKGKGIDGVPAYRKWAVAGGHPDKGGDPEEFKKVLGCEEDFFINKKCDWNYWSNYGIPRPQPQKPQPQPQRPQPQPQRPQPQQQRPKQRSRSRASRTPPKSGYPCQSGYEKNPKNGRCRKSCKSRQIRNSVTGRCRNVKARKSRARSRSRPKSPKKKYTFSRVEQMALREKIFKNINEFIDIDNIFYYDIDNISYESLYKDLRKNDLPSLKQFAQWIRMQGFPIPGHWRMLKQKLIDSLKELIIIE